jgi:hypothetical protein
VDFSEESGLITRLPYDTHGAQASHSLSIAAHILRLGFLYQALVLCMADVKTVQVSATRAMA